MAPALFVVGTSRSGTSWAFDLMASHPDMSMGYESKLPVEGIDVYRRFRSQLGSVDAMRSFLHALHDEIDDPSNEELRTRLLRADVVEAAARAHADSPGWAAICETIFTSLEGTSHWGNKMLQVVLTPTLREIWPDARFVVLTRDPRGVLASQTAKFDHSIEYSAMYWNTHADFVRDRLGLLPGEADEHVMVVDLVRMATDPRPTLEWAFDGVGLDLSPIDSLIDRYPGDPDRLDAWRSKLDPQRQRRVEEYCFDAMTALGYTPELATGRREMGRARKVWALAREHGNEIRRDPGSIRRKRIASRIKAALAIGS